MHAASLYIYIIYKGHSSLINSEREREINACLIGKMERLIVCFELDLMLIYNLYLRKSRLQTAVIRAKRIKSIDTDLINFNFCIHMKKG